MMIAACDSCLIRSSRIDRLAGHLEPVRAQIQTLLALDDDELIAALNAESISAELDGLDVGALRRRCSDVDVAAVCRCDPGYPPRLLELAGAPAVLYVAGSVARFLELSDRDPVAVVGARRASEYGREVAGALGRGLGRAGVAVISGMAHGIDSAAHSGAIAAGCPTVAVLPAGPERPYPAGKRRLFEQIRRTGALVSERPPGAAVWRWALTARNRIIASLSAMTVVVEAGERSGALITARIARTLGRPVGAVPGRVTASLAAGPNELLAGGATVVRGPQDVLDELFGAGVRRAQSDDRAALPDELRALLKAIGDGRDTAAALTTGGIAPEDALRGLAVLELDGYVRRLAGGRFAVVA
jgi:DNA processing protein